MTEEVRKGGLGNQLGRRLLTDFEKVHLGMNRQEVHQILGEKVIMGYTMEGPDSPFAPITLENPYRQETLLAGDRVYAVEYFWTRIVVPDGLITDEELTPLVFQEERLMGIGWDFLKGLK